MQDLVHPEVRLSSSCYALSSEERKQLSRDRTKAKCPTILNTMSPILLPHTPGAPLDTTFIFQCITANIICSIVFGECFDYSECQFLCLLELFYWTFSLISSLSSQVSEWEKRNIQGRGNKKLLCG